MLFIHKNKEPAEQISGFFVLIVFIYHNVSH